MFSPSLLVFLALAIISTSAFVIVTPQRASFVSPPLFAQGFDKTPKSAPKEKTAGAIKREQERSTYDNLSNTGGQEYTIFVRLFGQDDEKWIPAGAVAVPRGEQVAKAIYANEEGIKSGILRSFPGMKDDVANFEFGYNLKIYPDDPIQLAVKPTGEVSGFSAVTKWFDALLSPVDTSDVGKK